MIHRKGGGGALSSTEVSLPFEYSSESASADAVHKRLSLVLSDLPGFSPADNGRIHGLLRMVNNSVFI